MRYNPNVTGRGLSTISKSDIKGTSAPSSIRESNRIGGRSDDFRIDDGHRNFYVRDHNVVRVPPRERDFMAYHHINPFYRPDSRCFGYRVKVLPTGFTHITRYGVEYYCYNDVYYRPYRGHYVVCRPPFGIGLAAAITNLSLSAVTFAYYTNTYRTYAAIDANNRYIDEQNRIIAQNNAYIARQNRAVAMNLTSADDAYTVASALGLVQSYANADQEYFYQDGVFYVVAANGRYVTIVPPAGAIVQSLPEDYSTIILGGKEYYRVDDTVYRITMIDGTPYLEVLGQMYGSLARQYSQW